MKYCFRIKPLLLVSLAAVALAACGDDASSNNDGSTDELTCAEDEMYVSNADGDDYCIQECTADEQCGANALCTEHGYCTTHPYQDFDAAMVALNTEARRADTDLGGTRRTTTLVFADQGGEEACDLSDRYIPGPAGHEAWFRAGQHLVYIDLGPAVRHDMVDDHVCPQGVYEIRECYPSTSEQGREMSPPSGPNSGVSNPDAVTCASFVRVTAEPLETTVNAEPWLSAYPDETNGVIFHALIAKGGTVELTEISQTECEVNVAIDFGDGIVHRDDFVLTHPDGDEADAFDPPEMMCEQITQ